MKDFNNKKLKTLIFDTVSIDEYGKDSVYIQLPFLIGEISVDVILEKENDKYILTNKMYSPIYESMFSRSMNHMDFKLVLTSNTFLAEEKQDILKVEKIDYESLLMPKYVDLTVENIHYEVVKYAIAISKFFNKMIGYLQYVYLAKKEILVKKLDCKGYGCATYEFYVNGKFDTVLATNEYYDCDSYEKLVRHLIKNYGSYLHYSDKDYKVELKIYSIDDYYYISHIHKFKDKEIVVKSGDSYSENATTKDFIKDLNKILDWNIKYVEE